MSDNALLSMSQQFSGLDMDSLIGGPLMAAAKANGNMARTQIDFLTSTCFTTKTAANGMPVFEPIMIDLTLKSNVISDGGEGAAPKVTPIESVISLPILTIMPLNSLAVESVDVDFTMEVKSSFSETTADKQSSTTSAEAELTAKAGWGPFSVEIRGSVSHTSDSSSSRDTHYEKSNSASYNIKVHAGQIPLPVGVTTIIDAYSKNISPVQIGSS